MAPSLALLGVTINVNVFLIFPPEPGKDHFLKTDERGSKYNAILFTMILQRLILKKWNLVGLVTWRVSSHFHIISSPISSPCRGSNHVGPYPNFFPNPAEHPAGGSYSAVPIVTPFLTLRVKTNLINQRYEPNISKHRNNFSSGEL